MAQPVRNFIDFEALGDDELAQLLYNEVLEAGSDGEESVVDSNSDDEASLSGKDDNAPDNNMATDHAPDTT